MCGGDFKGQNRKNDACIIINKKAALPPKQKNGFFFNDVSHITA